MALSRSMFKVLVALAKSNTHMTQRQLSAASGLSLGTVNGVLHEAEDAGLIADGMLTIDGLKSLKPYEVENAIIMAAGLSSRLAPISYEKPKGLLRVRGEVLIERQLNSRSMGVTDITGGGGATRRSTSSIWQVSLVCASRSTRNMRRGTTATPCGLCATASTTPTCARQMTTSRRIPSSTMSTTPYYATQYVDTQPRSGGVTTGSSDRITQDSVGGTDAWTMLGHAYFDRAFSTSFVPLLDDAVRRPELADRLWEDIFRALHRRAGMAARRYPGASIHEFDTLDQVSGFDPAFIENVDSNIFDNIVSVLGCEKSQIHGFYPLKQGLTNLSCHFSVGEGAAEQEYVYRHPGLGTEKMVDRAAEEAGPALARAFWP